MTFLIYSPSDGIDGRGCALRSDDLQRRWLATE